MKTNFLPRSKRKSRPVLAVVAGVFIGGVIIFSLLDRPLLATIAPLWQGRNFVSQKASSVMSMFRFKSSLVSENEALKARVAMLEAENLSFRAAQSREETLLRSLGRVVNSGGIAASVLSRPPQTPYDMLIIDAGEQEGVKVGQRVSLPEGGLLGHVEEVLARSARVKLSTSSGEKTNAVLERGNLPVILEGYGGGSFKLILPRDVPVEVGDRVLSPYIEAGLLGVVRSVELRQTDSYKEVLIQGPANIQMIRFVKVH